MFAGHRNFSLWSEIVRAEKSLRGGLVLFHFLEKLLDPEGALFGNVEREVQFGQAAHLQALDELVANVTGSVLERFNGAILLLGIIRTHDNEDTRMLHVRLNTDFTDADMALEAGIFQFAGKHGVDFVGDLLADAFMTMVRAHLDLTWLRKRSAS